MEKSGSNRTIEKILRANLHLGRSELSINANESGWLVDIFSADGEYEDCLFVSEEMYMYHEDEERVPLRTDCIHNVEDVVQDVGIGGFDEYILIDQMPSIRNLSNFRLSIRNGGFPSKKQCELLHRLLGLYIRFHDFSKDDEYASYLYKMHVKEIEAEYDRQREKEKNKPQKDNRTNIYLMRNTRNGYTKIGHSFNPEFREKTLQSEEPEIDLMLYFPGTTEDETELHLDFHRNRIRGEWFNLSQNDIQKIIQDYSERGITFIEGSI